MSITQDNEFLENMTSIWAGGVTFTGCIQSTMPESNCLKSIGNQFIDNKSGEYSADIFKCRSKCT